MTVKGKLIAALDFKKDKKQPHIQYSYRHEGKWFVVKAGPGYSSTYEVSEYDDEGLKLLESMEDEESGK